MQRRSHTDALLGATKVNTGNWPGGGSSIQPDSLDMRERFTPTRYRKGGKPDGDGQRMPVITPKCPGSSGGAVALELA